MICWTAWDSNLCLVSRDRPPCVACFFVLDTETARGSLRAAYVLPDGRRDAGGASHWAWPDGVRPR